MLRFVSSMNLLHGKQTSVVNFCISYQRGTVVEKLTEETLSNQMHLKELLSFCESIPHIYVCHMF